MKNQLCRAENALFSLIVLIILVLNIYASVFLVQGYHPVYFKNQSLIFLFSLMILVLFFLFFKKIKYSNKKIFYIILALNLFCLGLRLFLNCSFITGPTSDQAALIYSVNDLVLAEEYAPILKGGYLNIQSHLASFYYFFYWPMKLFEAHYQYYYHLNAALIQLSFFLFSVNVYRIRGSRSGLATAVLLNLFIPSYFLDFVIYGDVLSLFFISLVFTAGVNLKGFWLKGMLVSVLLALSYMCRATAVVWFIASLIVMVLFLSGKKKELLLISIMVICFIIPSNLSTAALNNKFGADLPRYSLPSSTWISIGLNYNNNGDAGLYDSTSLDNLIGSGYNKDYVNELNNQRIMNALSSYKNIRELFSFMKNKLCNTWIDPDFETMNYVMPDNGMTVEKFKDNPDLVNGIAPKETKCVNFLSEFIYDHFQEIRIVEKGYVFIILMIALLTGIAELKNNKPDKTSVFLQLNLVGYFLLQLFMETKPRYILISFILLIVYCGLEIEKSNSVFNWNNLKRNQF